MTPPRRIERLSDGVTLHLGDCREIIAELPPCAAVISDPPYGINFAHSGGGGEESPAENTRQRSRVNSS
jgi:DNA modification methylase